MAEGSGGLGHIVTPANRRLGSRMIRSMYASGNSPVAAASSRICSFTRLAAPLGRPAPGRFPPCPFIVLSLRLIENRAPALGIQFTCTTFNSNRAAGCPCGELTHLPRRSLQKYEHSILNHCHAYLARHHYTRGLKLAPSFPATAARTKESLGFSGTGSDVYHQN